MGIGLMASSWILNSARTTVGAGGICNFDECPAISPENLCPLERSLRFMTEEECEAQGAKWCKMPCDWRITPFQTCKLFLYKQPSGHLNVSDCIWILAQESIRPTCLDMSWLVNGTILQYLTISYYNPTFGTYQAPTAVADHGPTESPCQPKYLWRFQIFQAFAPFNYCRLSGSTRNRPKLGFASSICRSFCVTFRWLCWLWTWGACHILMDVI